jgi:hypothetical protein
MGTCEVQLQPHRVVPLAGAFGRASVTAEQPIDGDAAELGDPLQRVNLGPTVPTLVPEHRVPAHANPGREGPLREAEAGANDRDRCGRLSWMTRFTNSLSG